MAEELSLEQTEFDYIVLGTGLVESILAGSLARIGKKVLHVDSHQNYGGNWAVFSFRDLYEWATNKKEIEQNEQGENIMNYESNYNANFRNFEFYLSPNSASSTAESEDINEETLDGLNIKVSSVDQNVLDRFIEAEKKREDLTTSEKAARIRLFGDLIQKSRSYNLDTVPKLLGSRDELVETLIRSGVGRYLEFKNVENIYVFDDDLNVLEKVPSSREDVFTNKAVSLIEKRKLMKFLTFSMDYENSPEILQDSENMTYSEFLKDKFKISGKLQKAIIYAIALSGDKTSAKDGLEATHRFVKAMGRFGRGSYLCPLYGGASEIGQAFCRVCAVYGGTYILNQPLKSFIIDKETNDCTGIVTMDQQEFKSKKIITGLDYLNKSWISNEEQCTFVSRAIVVTDTPLATIDSENFIPADLSYSLFPPGSKAGNKDEPIYAIHQSHESMACPQNQFVTYFWTTSKEEGVVKNAVNLLLQRKEIKEEDKEKEVNDIECKFVLYFEQRLRSINDLEFKLPNNIIPCSDPDATIDFNSVTKEARDTFYKCESSDTEFMPAADQDPDEEF